MTGRKTSPTTASGTRGMVLAAAERLLATGSTGFSMRDLAAEAGVSFATPFNQFGSKAEIMHALSAQRIERMTTQFTVTADAAAGAPARVLMAVDIAARVMLERPAVNRTVMGVLGTPTGAPGDAAQRSRRLWSMALGDGRGLLPGKVELACTVLPDHLAFGFRGVLSFWSAGEIADEALQRRARQIAAALMLSYVDGREEAMLARLLRVPS